MFSAGYFEFFFNIIICITFILNSNLNFRIHSQGTRGIRESHPDTRAFLFEEKKYSKKKILDFISALNGFKIALKTVRLFESN